MYHWNQLRTHMRVGPGKVVKQTQPKRKRKSSLKQIEKMSEIAEKLILRRENTLRTRIHWAEQRGKIR